LVAEDEPIDRDVVRQRKGLLSVGCWRGEALVGKIWVVEYMERLEERMYGCGLNERLFGLWKS
jgi:hypothetical protein